MNELQCKKLRTFLNITSSREYYFYQYCYVYAIIKVQGNGLHGFTTLLGGEAITISQVIYTTILLIKGRGKVSFILIHNGLLHKICTLTNKV